MSDRLRIPVGRTTSSHPDPDRVDDGLDEDQPLDGGETHEEVEINPALVATQRELEVHGRRGKLVSLRRLGLSKEDWSGLGDRASTLSKRPGFTPRLVTLVLLTVLLSFAFAMLTPSTAQLVLIVALGLVIVVVSALALSRAYEPIPVEKSGTVAPVHGLPKWKYRVLKFYGRPDLVPAMKPDELRETRIRFMEERIREVRMYIRPVIWIANSSGKNGKSMMSVIIASIIGRVTRQPCFVLPTMANDKTGRAGKLTGLKGHSASMRQLHTLIEDRKMTDPGQVYNYVFSNADGAYVVSEDPVGDIGAKYLGNGMFRKVLKFLLRASPIAVLDTGNDGAHENSVTATGLEEAHVAILTAWVENVDGMDKLKEALAEYVRYARLFEKVGLSQGLRLTATDIPMEEKIRKSIAIFNGVDTTSDLSTYADHVRIDMDNPPAFEGDIHCVRYDEYLRYLLEGFSIDMMARDTYLDYLSIIALAFERAAELMGVEVPARHPFIVNPYDMQIVPN